MKILDRYIAKQIILAILLVTIALVAVDMVFYFINELRHIGKGDYNFSAAMAFISLAIPRKIYTDFPWAALLGSLLALGNLAKNSELVAMRVASVSVSRIAWSTIKAGLYLTIVMFICGEVVSPITESWAQQRKTLALSRGQAIQTQFGTWVRHGNKFIHVGVVKQNNFLQEITNYEFSPQMQLQSVSHSGTAIKHDDYWRLIDLHSTKFADDAIKVINADEIKIPELLDTEILEASGVKHLERLTLNNLWRVIKSRVAQELNATEYQRAFWLKISQPFAILVMIFLAVPFAFGPLRSASVGLKVLVGILVGFSFYTMNAIFGPLTSVVGLSPMLAAMIPTLVFFTIGCWMVSRVP